MAAVRRRAPWVLAACVLALLALGARTWYWQVRRGPGLTRAAVAQRMQALPLGGRGTMLDRAGRPLSDPRARWGVAVFPVLLAGGPGAVAPLAPVLGRDPADLVAGAARGAGAGEPFWLDRDLPADVAARAGAVGVPGVAVAPLPERYGPGALARHLVGYVNRQGGQLGLEAAFDRALAGQAGPHLAVFLDGTHRRRPLAGLGVRQVEVGEGKAPWDLHLTLDAGVQAAVEAALDGYRLPETAGAEGPAPDPGGLRAAVVVLAPGSGDLLALASRPQFDPRTGPPPGVDPGAAPLLNRAVAAYPPGSTFKALLAAAALDEGVLTPEHRYFCPGHFDLGGTRFQDFEPSGHGWVDLQGALAQSCNVYFIHVGYELMGRERLLDAARRFGFGQALDLGLWGEASGHLPAATYGGEVAQLAFGQGVEVTPLQLARAYAALVRDGTLPPVGLVTRVTAPGGEVLVRPRRVPEQRAVGAAAARTVARLLGGVTDPAGTGTGRGAWVPDGGSAGKTGSAQGAGGVSHAWFAGWAPLGAPRYVIVVFVEDGGLGGRVAAPLFRAVASRLVGLTTAP